MGHEVTSIAAGNYVAFTFFIGTMAMMAALSGQAAVAA